MVGMPLVMASSKGMPKSLDARRIGKTACQLIEGWQVFVRYLMMEVEKMLNALLLEVGLYLVYIRGSSAYSHHMILAILHFSSLAFAIWLISAIAFATSIRFLRSSMLPT